jgi:opacity protein-like surface antigen
MKRIAKVFGTAALGLGLLATAAQAQSSTPLTWNAGVGLSMPSNSGINTGFNARVGVTIPLTGEPIWIRPEATLDHFSVSNTVCGVLTDCGSFTLFGVGADAGYTFHTTGKIGAYALAGLRINHLSYSVAATGASATKLGVNLGAGITFPLASKVGFVELRFEDAGGGFNLWPITFGLRF